jgi:hypothetical protein
MGDDTRDISTTFQSDLPQFHLMIEYLRIEAEKTWYQAKKTIELVEQSRKLVYRIQADLRFANFTYRRDGSGAWVPRTPRLFIENPSNAHVSAAIEALDKAGVRHRDSATVKDGEAEYGLILIDLPDKARAIAALREAGIIARPE